MSQCQDIPGVLPLLDYSIPDKPRANTDVWLVSACAIPLNQVRPNDLEDTVKQCALLAKTLSDMHARGFSHRDIKPQNIFLHQGRWCIGDFGIAEVPNKPPITMHGEKIGAIHYIAPEMLNDAMGAKGDSADVYSMAKLLWKLASGQNYPLPGVQFAHEKAMTISGYVNHRYAYLLDRLLEASTQVNPSSRPKMKDFATELFKWLEPPQEPTKLDDLTRYRKRIMSMTQPYDDAVIQRANIQATAHAELNRVFNCFRDTLVQIESSFREAGFSDVAIAEPGGGNADFYFATTNGVLPAPSERVYFFQFSSKVSVRDPTRRASLLAGVNLGIKNVPEISDPLYDIYAPVIAAAGFVIKSEVLISGFWKESTKNFSNSSDIFSFGQPSEVLMVERLINVLKSNLAGAVESFIDVFEGKNGNH